MIHIGNFLIIASLTILLITYWPLLQFFTPLPVSATVQNSDFTISIPKINAAAPVVTGVDPWSQSEYMKALQKGVAQAKGSSLPGQNGTIYLFAHSSLPPWEMTRINTAFLRLGELQPGDKIAINFRGVEYSYKVFDKKELWPDNAQYLIQSTSGQPGQKTLILQTCTPLGTALKRLLIFAEPVNILNSE